MSISESTIVLINKNKKAMEKIVFSTLKPEHEQDVMEIFNYYVMNTFAAYPEKVMPQSYFKEFINMSKGYPAKVVISASKIIGFGFLRPYKPFSTFKTSAEITYFIHNKYRGQGIGSELLSILELEAKRIGVKNIFASIVSRNTSSIGFHEKNGFVRVATLPEIGEKFEKIFDIVWMKKTII